MRSRSWIMLHALFVMLPVVGAFVRAPDVALFGVEEPGPRPAWSVSAWRDERLQPAVQGWFESHIGFRGVMIRSENTSHLLALRSEKPGSPVVPGTDGTLFFRDSIQYLNLRPGDLRTTVERAEQLSARLGSIRRKLKPRGGTLVVIIAPTKAALDESSVPPRFRPPERSDIVVHDAVRESLERNGVPFADANEVLGRWQGADRDLVFPRTARHWTRFGACEVLRRALPEADSGAPPDCAYDLVEGDRATHPDFDLYRIQDLWRVETTVARVPALRNVERVRTSDERARRTLLVGTSFIWALAEAMVPHAESAVALYYNQRFYDVTGFRRNPLEEADPRTEAWARYVLDRDLYIVEILEEYLHLDYLAGFLTTLETRLDVGLDRPGTTAP